MQLCTLWGNMSADRTDEQYPQANVCDECIQKYSTAEESPIVHINGSYESAYGEECALGAYLEQDMRCQHCIATTNSWFENNP